jgi:hypothetical protein
MAHFRARFWKIFAAGYSVPLTLTGTNGQYVFEGQADLGALGGGAYTYNGTVTPLAMESTYNCKRDHGTFVLRRPQRGEVTHEVAAPATGCNAEFARSRRPP